MNEHDLNNGLHDRVTLTDAGLLRDKLLLADGDMRLIDTLGDLLFDAGIDFVRVTLNPNVGVRLGEAITDIVLVIDTAIDGDAENEQDLNNGLHDRVTLDDGGLLRDKLMLGDCDFDIPN